MRDLQDLLLEKEKQLQQLGQEIEALRLVMDLLPALPQSASAEDATADNRSFKKFSGFAHAEHSSPAHQPPER